MQKSASRHKKERSVEKLRLDRHRVLDAVARPGRTYTLEQIVRRLVVEDQTDLDNILLVTYTDKATRALKIRLRETLQQPRSEMPEHRALFQAALGKFDQTDL